MEASDIRTLQQLLSGEMSKEKIMAAAGMMGIAVSSVSRDLYVDVDGDAVLPNIGLRRIPFKFRYVNGSFDCSRLMLGTLLNCPIEVGLDFSCCSNYLKDLTLGPKAVGRSYHCRSNSQMYSLAGVPDEIPGDLDASFCGITSLAYAPRRVGGKLLLVGNMLTSLQGRVEEAGEIICHGNKIITVEHGIRVPEVDFSGNPVDPADDLEKSQWG